MSSNSTPLPYKAYSRASLTTAKTRQLVMLYDGIIRNLMQAQHAIANHNPEQRFERLMKASEIVLVLQSSLDLNAGGDVATSLSEYYASLDSQILQHLNSNDANGLETLIDDVRNLRKSWDDIDTDNAARIASDAANDSHEVSA